MSPRFGSRHIAGAAAVGAAGAFVAAKSALARWERSHLATEEIAHIHGAEELRVRSADGAELSVVVARAERRPAKDDAAPATFVLAHGWTNDRRVWAPVARRLVDGGHDVVCYDHRGHGSSTIGSSGLTLEALADDMRAVLDHVDASEAVLAGHSMGGMTAQALASSNPQAVSERVGAIVLVATACVGVSRGQLVDRLGPRIIAHRHLDSAMRMRSVGPFLVRRTFGRETCRSHLETVCEMFAATPPHVRAGFLESMNTMDLTEGLAKVDVPVTVVAGERDNLLPARHSRRIAGIVPGSRLVEIPHAGHMLPIEVPEQIAALLHEAARQRRRAHAGHATRPGHLTESKPLTDVGNSDEETPEAQQTTERSVI